MNDVRPFAEVAVHERLQVPLQIGGDSQAVVDEDSAELDDSPFQFVEPHRRTRKAIGRANVEHDEAIEIPHGGVGIDVRNEQICVPRIRPTVSADVDIPPSFGRDKTEVLTFCFGALANADR